MADWQFLHRWYMPFVWLALCSVVTVPLAIYFESGMTMHQGSELGLAYGHSWVLRDHFLEAIVIYLLNLGCAVWLLDSDGSTRWAAFWSLLAGIGRIVAPVALVSMSDVTVGNSHYIDWSTVRIVLWFGDFQMFAFGIMLWAVFAHFVGQGSSAHAPAYAEAH
jgi:hypothetical protein